jgi:NADP-reducing hydrogenase subunit HndC
LKTYRTHLLVCAGTGCVSCGAFDLKDALGKEIARRNLQDEILIIATGCNGFCERGPILMVHPDGVFYQRLKVQDVPFLV